MGGSLHDITAPKYGGGCLVNAESLERVYCTTDWWDAGWIHQWINFEGRWLELRRVFANYDSKDFQPKLGVYTVLRR
jgi:hypothetical protein